jgi:ribosomal protein S18 acetylase RimI-like enzyme
MFFRPYISSNMPAFQIIPARTPAQISAAKELFTIYATWLNINLDFQNFTQELDSLPGLYAPPTGEIFLAYPTAADSTTKPIGCIALRPLKVGSEFGEDTGAKYGEMKRLYVAPEGRGTGLGKELVEKVLNTAKILGYSEIRLDTLPRMEAARKLYAKYGFKECEKYYETPLEGTIFMKKTL